MVLGCSILVPHMVGKLKVDYGRAGVPWRDMAEDGSVDDGRDNFYYVLNNVITGNHLPCPLTVEPILPELPQVNLQGNLLQACARSQHCSQHLMMPAFLPSELVQASSFIVWC